MRYVLFAVAVLSLLLAPQDGRACLVVGGPQGSPKVSGEEVLVAWDGTTEQLVRHLSFAGATSDFGFIVPTPSKPMLDEVDDKIFAALFDVYRRHMPKTIPSNLMPAKAGIGAHSAGAAPPVTVIEQKRVAGLDATVLRATDPEALAAWLKRHNYTTSPATADYLKPYVAQGFFLTAFQYKPSAAPSAANEALHTRAVKITFQSDRPFFPYAEPSDAPFVWNRAFRVTVIAPSRVRGQLGTAPWATFPSFAGRLSSAWEGRYQAPPEEAGDKAGDRKGWEEVRTLAKPSAWMTTFDERGERRGADDLFFVTDPAPTELHSGIEDQIE